MNSLLAACDLKAMHTPCASLLSNRTKYREGRKMVRGIREEVAGECRSREVGEAITKA